MSITKQEFEEILNKALDKHLEPIIYLTQEIKHITKEINEVFNSYHCTTI